MRNIVIAASCLCLLMGVPSPLYGYVDGGTSLLFLQSALAAFSAMLFVVKSPVQTVRRFFSRLGSRKDA